MPNTYEVELSDGRVVEVQGERQPTEEEVHGLLKGYQRPSASQALIDLPTPRVSEGEEPWKALAPERIAALNPLSGVSPEPRSTIYGGPRKPLASLAETVVEPTEMITAPHLTIPDIPIKEDDEPAMVVGKEAVNIAKSIPEFFSSDIGGLSLIAGMAAPTAVGAGFTASMLKDLGEQISSTHKNWDEMSRSQKLKAVTDIGGTGLMALLAGTSTAGTLIKPKAGMPVSPTGELPPTALGWQRLKANIEELRGKVAGLPGSRALPVPPIHAPTPPSPAPWPLRIQTAALPVVLET